MNDIAPDFGADLQVATAGLTDTVAPSWRPARGASRTLRATETPLVAHWLRSASFEQKHKCVFALARAPFKWQHQPGGRRSPNGVHFVKDGLHQRGPSY